MISIQDIERISKKEIQSAGPRYTPSVHSNAPNLQIATLAEAIAGLLLGKQFKEKVSTLTDELKDELHP
jgi:hypothetical protein